MDYQEKQDKISGGLHNKKHVCSKGTIVVNQSHSTTFFTRISQYLQTRPCDPLNDESNNPSNPNIINMVLIKKILNATSKVSRSMPSTKPLKKTNKSSTL